SGPFVEYLRNSLKLEQTPALSQFLRDHERKQLEIPASFYESFAMLQNTWKQPDRPLRHVLTRFAAHGFHHKICRISRFHEAGSADCRCTLCGATQINNNDLLRCTSNQHSLTDYAS